MLIDCPECEQKVSDKALSCPHCGYPLTKTEKKTVKPQKHMRLPNGFGRITKLNGKLRKPYRVMVSQGKDESGRPIGKLLKPVAYFSTYNEAYMALVEYNKSPYDITNPITMNELFEKWFTVHEKEIVPKRARDLRKCWEYCAPIYSLDVTTIRTRVIREFLDTLNRTDTVKHNIRSILSMMFDYGVEYEYVAKNIIKDMKFKSSENEQSEPAHTIFTDEEFSTIVANKESFPYNMIYIQCYTGMRPDELCRVEVNKLDMKEWIIIGGSKTKAGKNRTVPIHKNIRKMIRERHNNAIKSGSLYLFTTNKGERLTYDMFYRALVAAFPNHKPHDCRKHFITMAKKAGVDEYAIKLIVGHSIQDITEAVYTQRDTKWLHKELSKIP